MALQAVYPAGSEESARGIKVSPGVISHGHVFFTGMTGSQTDGSLAADPAQQFRDVFDKIGNALSAAGLSFASVVEMTSYHVGLKGHFDLFNAIRGEYVLEPYPAWTAVEVAGLRREGAVVEIRVIAALDAPVSKGPESDT